MLRASVMDLFRHLEGNARLGPASNHTTAIVHGKDMRGRFPSCSCHFAR